MENFSGLMNYFDDKDMAVSSILSEEELQAFQQEKKTIHVRRGDLLLEENHAPNGVYYIISGTAKLFKVGFTGKEQIIRFIKEGDLIGYRSILSGENFGSSVTAIEDLKVDFIPERFFIKLLKNNAELSFEMLTILSRQLGNAADTITTLAQKTVRERLAEILLLLENQLGTDEEGYIKVMLTREEIANLIGTATESTIRLISEFKNDGLIDVHGRKLKITNRNMIHKLAHV